MRRSSVLILNNTVFLRNPERGEGCLEGHEKYVRNSEFKAAIFETRACGSLLRYAAFYDILNAKPYETGAMRPVLRGQ